MLIADIMPIPSRAPNMLRDGGLPNQSPGGAARDGRAHTSTAPAGYGSRRRALLDGHLHRDREGRDCDRGHDQARSIRKCSVATAAKAYHDHRVRAGRPGPG